MANNFKVWVDNGSDVMTSSAFINDNERQNGFRSGTAAHSAQMNTALRQANLIGCALMNVVAPNDSSVNVQSTVDSVKNVINTGLTNLIKTTKVDSSTSSDSATNATNVTSKIDGVDLKHYFNFDTITTWNKRAALDSISLSLVHARKYYNMTLNTSTNPHSWSVIIPLLDIGAYQITLESTFGTIRSAGSFGIVDVYDNTIPIEASCGNNRLSLYYVTGDKTQVITSSSSTSSGTTFDADSMKLIIRKLPFNNY